MLTIFKITYYSLKSKFGRKILSLKYLNNIKVGSNLKWERPYNLRGNGKLILGKNVTILKNIFITKANTVELGDNCTVENDVKIVTNDSSYFRCGKNVGIGQFSSFKINSNCHIKIGDNVSISPRAQIFPREKGHCGNLLIGNNSNISDNAVIDLTDDITIGNGVALGHEVTIFTHNHDYTNPDFPAWKGGITKGKVNIGDGCWIGAKVTIMPGITIGARSIVATGSIVTKNIPQNTLVAGVPAREIKKVL